MRRRQRGEKEGSSKVSYSNVDDTLEGYKIKSALPFKIFSTLSNPCSNDVKNELIGQGKVLTAQGYGLILDIIKT